LKLSEKFVLFSVCILFAAASFTGSIAAQTRDRVVRTSSSQPINLPPPAQPDKKVQNLSSSRPVLTNEIRIIDASAAEASLVKKTASSSPVNLAAASSTRGMLYSDDVSNRLDQAIKSRYGLRYVYGSSGPNSYDCSGFVWSVFSEAGMPFTRSSARSLWAVSEPVTDDEKFKFGTLVFMNGLGHMGIVADENGFFHASTSKGITYSPFKGYWAKRIVGFRKLKTGVTAADVAEIVELAK
jgi:cell wall-associated NlpC family hydrolase